MVERGGTHLSKSNPFDAELPVRARAYRRVSATTSPAERADFRRSDFFNGLLKPDRKRRQALAQHGSQ